MNLQTPFRAFPYQVVSPAILLASALLLFQNVASAQDYFDFEPDDANILTRGPVHEAFAEPIVFDPEPGPIAPTAPPEEVEEYPPDQQPEGMNVTWIPGYWAWDDELSNYIWVSGIWRDIPPGRDWVGGYWARTPQGHQWIAGYWADMDSNETYYLPEPPVTVETGPNLNAAPSPNHIWAPGTWVWHDVSYGWRPGYWMEGRPDWVWVPAHYAWTPRGYVFIDGYWDYELESRGVLFAPVRFEPAHLARRGYRYTPRTVIDVRVFTDHLFVRPRHSHYYFGDYYEERYVNIGFRPWFSVHTSRKVYDPIYVHRRWKHRGDRDWDSRLRRDFDHRRRDRDSRPPRTWADQRRSRELHDRNRSGSPFHGIARALSQVTRRKDSPLRFRRVDDGERSRYAARRQDLNRGRLNRRSNETREDRPDNRYNTRTRPAKVTRQKSPISSRPVRELTEKRRPPVRQEQPKVDRSVQPRKRAEVKRQPTPRREDNRREGSRDRNANDRGPDRGKDAAEDRGRSKAKNKGGKDRDKDKRDN